MLYNVCFIHVVCYITYQSKLNLCFIAGDCEITLPGCLSSETHEKENNKNSSRYFLPPPDMTLTSHSTAGLCTCSAKEARLVRSLVALAIYIYTGAEHTHAAQIYKVLYMQCMYSTYLRRVYAPLLTSPHNI